MSKEKNAARTKVPSAACLQSVLSARFGLLCRARHGHRLCTVDGIAPDSDSCGFGSESGARSRSEGNRERAARLRRQRPAVNARTTGRQHKLTCVRAAEREGVRGDERQRARAVVGHGEVKRRRDLAAGYAAEVIARRRRRCELNRYQYR